MCSVNICANDTQYVCTALWQPCINDIIPIRLIKHSALVIGKVKTPIPLITFRKLPTRHLAKRRTWVTLATIIWYLRALKIEKSYPNKDFTFCGPVYCSTPRHKLREGCASSPILWTVPAFSNHLTKESTCHSTLLL